MNVVTLEFKKCCECGARATKTLELLEFDERGIVGPADPKHYCNLHFPEPMGDDQLRLLLDMRDAEIERLRAALELIAGSSTDELQAIQARNALDRID